MSQRIFEPKKIPGSHMADDHFAPDLIAGNRKLGTLNAELRQLGGNSEAAAFS